MADRLIVEVVKYAAISASEEMGVVLRNTAYSPNIKDRLDFTCSVLTPKGELVAQAEHIPVHLGSMEVGVRNTLKYLEKEGVEPEEGDVIIVNDPYIAGTHLNDVLMLKPVYYNGRLIAYVANKAHYVDIGGSYPGGMSVFARELYQEGLVIPPIRLVERGRLREDVLKMILSNVRAPEYVKGDIKAQIASLSIGERRVRELAERYGVGVVLDAWDEIIGYTERYTRNVVRSLGRFGESSAEDYLELGEGLIRIRARVEIKENGDILVDYSGTDRQVDTPLNAVYGVTIAATTFALKSVLDPEMPINHGFYKAVTIYVPEGSILNPIRPAPVSAGNTETSQRIVDVLYKALASLYPERVPAASCGTMSNVIIGGVKNDGRYWVFYETIGGGSGGRPNGDGIDGVHTNMTNTLNTPIERIESEYPIMVVRYGLRENSGGLGMYRGGLGIVRAFRLLEGKAVVTIIADRQRTRPWGLNGGLPGAGFRACIVKSDGRVLELPCKCMVDIEKGDTVYIETPGGGGYGDPRLRDSRLIRRDLEEGRYTGDALRAVHKSGKG